MNKIISALHEHATYIAQHRAIEDEKSVLTYRQLLTMVEHVAARLTVVSPQVVAIFAENGIASVVGDLAAISLGVPVVALPADLSKQKLLDVIRKTGVDCVLTDRPDAVATLGIDISNKPLPISAELFAIELVVDAHAPTTLPPGTAKIVVNVGKKSEPNYLYSGRAELEFAAESLLGVAASMQGDRHLCLSPLATCHENIGGIYTTILAGATICVPRLKNLGITGESIHVDQLAASLETWCATSVLTIPKILRSLVDAAGCGIVVPSTIRYVAVAGAFPPALLAAADRQRIPVYEGRALVERTAVISINRPPSWRHGNIEKALPRVSVVACDDAQRPSRSTHRW